jgi:hypothetical protein
MTTTVLRHDDSGSVLVSNGEFQAWIDVDVVNKDVRLAWNKDIFYLTDPQDVFERQEQNKIENFIAFTDAAKEYLETIGVLRYTDGKGYSWHKENLEQKIKG